MPNLHHILDHAISVTTQIQKALQSKEAIVIAALFPGGSQAAAACIAACEVAITACKAVEAITDSPAVQAILQRLGSDIARLQHNGGHSVGWYIMRFEERFGENNE